MMHEDDSNLYLSLPRVRQAARHSSPYGHDSVLKKIKLESNWASQTRSAMDALDGQHDQAPCNAYANPQVFPDKLCRFD